MLGLWVIQGLDWHGVPENINAGHRRHGQSDKWETIPTLRYSGQKELQYHYRSAFKEVGQGIVHGIIMVQMPSARYFISLISDITIL